MKVLHVLREYAEARSASWPRRLYGYAVAVILICLLIGMIESVVPIWIFWSIVISEAIFDTILVRHWIIHDAAARAERSES